VASLEGFADADLGEYIKLLERQVGVEVRAGS
jgi:hypothetical protein